MKKNEEFKKLYETSYFLLFHTGGNFLQIDLVKLKVRQEMVRKKGEVSNNN